MGVEGSVGPQTRGTSSDSVILGDEGGQSKPGLLPVLRPEGERSWRVGVTINSLCLTLRIKEGE